MASTICMAILPSFILEVINPTLADTLASALISRSSWAAVFLMTMKAAVFAPLAAARIQGVLIWTGVWVTAGAVAQAVKPMVKISDKSISVNLMIPPRML